MALPGGLTTITVTGTFLDADGDPCAVTVTFTPTALLTDSGDNVIFPPVPVRVTLDTSGHLSVVLPCTDNGGLAADGGGSWSYQVAETITWTQPAPQPPASATRSYRVALPSSLGASADLADLTHL